VLQDPHAVSEQLEGLRDDLAAFTSNDRSLATVYRDALLDEQASSTATEVREAVSGTFADALPTAEFDELAELTVPFPPASEWTSHESAGRWASDVLEGLPTVAVDGSELEPTTELNVPVGLVQVVSYVNHHTTDGQYALDARSAVLPPGEVVVGPGDGSYTYVDESQVQHARYERETETVCRLIEEYAEHDPPPVVIYDGSLTVSFANLFDDETRQRYIDAMAALLATSRAHEVPVVGYIAGSQSSDVADLIRKLRPSGLGDTGLPRDAAVFAPLLDTWGSRTALFESQRDRSLQQLRTTYRGEAYTFGDRLRFAYADFGEGESLDRLEVPQWLCETDAPTGGPGDSMFEYAFRAVQAEAAVGQGYPEAIQVADSEAVLTGGDRDRLLRMLLRLGEDNGVPIEWNPKDRSKRRRR
jgi:hypothetical protein